jgi:hypothetical protein
VLIRLKKIYWLASNIKNMPRKIYDIKPPKLANKKTEKSLKEVPVEIKVKKTVRRIEVPKAVKHREEKEYKPEKVKRSIKWPVLIGGLVVVLIIGVYLFVKLPKATITISPTVDTLSFKQTITADKSVKVVDDSKNIIPAQYFTATKTVSQDFPATGNADNTGMATGTVTIYNKCDPTTPLSIVKGINFLSNNNKVFATVQKKFVIPAGTKKGGKVTPGSIQAKVQAVEGGTSYNIAPATFSAPGLNGTVYYSCIYAVSTTAMSGGYSGKVKKVTDDDIQGAKDTLTQKATDEAMSAVKGQISSDFILLDNSALSNVTSASTLVKSGAVADSFKYNVTVQASALVFKKSDLEQFSKKYISSQIPDGKTLLDNSFKMDYSAPTIDVSGGKATINLDFSSGFYQNIDKNALTLKMLGENADQIKQSVSDNLADQVDNVNVKFWPFWVTSAPNNQSAVNINLKFN